jgi:phage head maturation protease
MAATETHEKVGHTGQGLWHHKGMQLPAYIQHVANDLIQSGHPESEAVQMAIGIIKNWAHGTGGHVTPETRAKAAAALAEWERLKAQAKVSKITRGGPMQVTERADAKAPYGTAVSYADPGYLDADGNQASKSGKPGVKRYPLSKDKVMAAWSYINQEKNAGQYTPDQLKAVKGKIMAAMKSAGHDMSTDTPAASRSGFGEYRRIWDLEDIHIVRTAQGDHSGRLVEAYAAAFGQRAEIHDSQGHYQEENDPGVFNDELAMINRSREGLAKVKVMFNHAMTIHGTPSDLDSLPVAVPEYIAPESRGLLTRARYLNTTRAEEVLEAIKAGAITAQSYTGRIIRSDPELPGPGARYRKRGGVLPLVRRLALGLKEFGPTPFPAFSGAEIMGVRMQHPDSGEASRYDEDVDEPEFEESAPDMEGDGTGGAPEDATSARYHQHALYAMRSRELREAKGLVF